MFALELQRAWLSPPESEGLNTVLRGCQIETAVTALGGTGGGSDSTELHRVWHEGISLAGVKATREEAAEKGAGGSRRYLVSDGVGPPPPPRTSP